MSAEIQDSREKLVMKVGGWRERGGVIVVLAAFSMSWHQYVHSAIYRNHSNQLVNQFSFIILYDVHYLRSN